MARNKKDKVKEQLTESEVNQVFEFAASYYNTALGLGKNVATPELVNNALQKITTNPLKPKEDIIEEALNDPTNNEKRLQGLMEYFYLTDMLSKRTVQYLSNILSFNVTYTCTNIDDPSEYESEAYKKDYNRIKNFFSKFNAKKEFRNIMQQMVKQETGYYIFRDDVKQYTFQELPRDYCKITGKWDYGLVFDFNMFWFTQPGVDIDMYPKSMKKMLNRLYSNMNEMYDPANPIGKRNSKWSYWTQTDPTENYWAFKFDTSSFASVPYLTGTFPDVVLRPLMRKLQTNSNILAAQKVMVGLIPLLKNVKSGQTYDQFAISPKQMGEYLGYLKQGLNDAIKVGGVPFSDVKVLDFPVSDSSMYNVYSANTASNSGVTSRVIYSSDKMTAAEVEMSKDVDVMLVKNVCSQFEDFLKFTVNKLTKKYKFNFKLEGTNFSSDKKERLDKWHKNAALGIVLPQQLAVALDMTPFELEAQMEEAKYSGFAKNLIGLMNLNTATTQNSESGRPKVDSASASESTERKLDYK